MDKFPVFTHEVFLSPTDTIIGLGCRSDSKEAIDRIFEIKKRPKDKNFILLVESISRLERMVNVSDFVKQAIINSQKPTTFIYDDIVNLPDYLVSKNGDIAIRLSFDPFVSALVGIQNCAIVSTSANLSGEESPLVIGDVKEEIKQDVDFIFPQSHQFEPLSEPSSIFKVKKERLEIVRA